MNLSQGEIMKPRKITPRELADLSENWQNAKIDTNKYYCHVLRAWEVDDWTLAQAKREGLLWQVQDGKNYLGEEGNLL